MGYHVPWVAPEGPDGGNDVIAYADSLGIGGPTIRIAVRRRGQSQSVSDIREFLSTLHDGDVGLFVATGGFTKDAQNLARHDERRLRLIDLDRFLGLWIESYSRIPEPERSLLPLRPVYFLVPRDSD
jgi:restriction system protein